MKYLEFPSDVRNDIYMDDLIINIIIIHICFIIFLFSKIGHNDDIYRYLGCFLYKY